MTKRETYFIEDITCDEGRTKLKAYNEALSDPRRPLGIISASKWMEMTERQKRKAAKTQFSDGLDD